MRAKCLAQKHHALTPARCQTRTAWSGVQCTNQYIMIIRRLKWLCSHSLPKYGAWVWFSLGSTAVNPICPGEVCHVWTQHNFVLVPRHQVETWPTVCCHDVRVQAGTTTTVSVCWWEVKSERHKHNGQPCANMMSFYSNRDSLNCTCTCKCGLIGGLFSFFAALSSSST